MTHGMRQPPFAVYEGMLKTLNADRLGLVKADHELVKNGWSLHFAVDPYDIQEFCFPFSHGDLTEQFLPEKIEQMSRLQNGRYEALYNHAKKPILLQPYEEELDQIKDWIQWSKFVPTEVDLLDKYLSILRIQPLDRPRELRDALAELTDRDISSLLAVVTGMVAIGSKRFNEIYWARLVRKDDVGVRLSGRTRLDRDDFEVNKVFRVLQQFFEQSGPANLSEGHEKWAQRSRHMIDRSNLRDAKAVHEILRLNRERNKHKELFLYLSSPLKSGNLFKAAPMNNEWPVIEGRRYYLVRTAADLFVYMVWKGESDDPIVSAEHAVSKLSELQELLKEVEAIRSAFQSASENCAECNGRGQSRCEFQVYCDGVMKYGQDIASSKDKNIKWPLERRLAAVIEDAKRSLAPDNGAQKYSALLDTLSEILGQKGTTARGQEMEVALTKARFVATFVRPPRLERHPDVSCHLNYYPMRLGINDRDLKVILNDVLALLPIKRWNNEKFNECVNRYLTVDFGRADDEQSELLRCFLYVVMQALDEGRRIADKFLDPNRSLPDRIRQEFRYLNCFLLWQDLKFAAAKSMADDGIKQGAKDGRFHHVRSLIMFTVVRGSDEQDWDQVIASAEKAREIFNRKKDADMEAVCCNNLAFFLSRPDAAVSEVERVDKYFQRLIQLIPEDEWDPIYPEFFHTKACVLLAKFRSSSKSDAAETRLLMEAHAYAAKAYDLYPAKPQHYQLLRIINDVARDASVVLTQD